ncbi:MAG TPA: peptidoglycan-binding protein [Caulobacteraceae bacterium]
MTDSVLDAVSTARAHLDAPAERFGGLGTLGAALLAATTAVLLAGAVVLGTGWEAPREPVTVEAPAN